jgi:hypothetical protein
MTGTSGVGAPKRGVKATVEIGRAKTNNFSNPENIVKTFRVITFAKPLITAVKPRKPAAICSHVKPETVSGTPASTAFTMFSDADQEVPPVELNNKAARATSDTPASA